MIKFKDIYIEGFGSIVNPLSFKFAEDGLTLIKGENGSGKTTLFSALGWVLYGQPIKKDSSIEPWEHTRGKNYRGTVVDLKFTKGKDSYRVIRFNDFKGDYGTFTKGKSRLILVINGEEFLKFQDKKDLNSKVKDILGLSFPLFKTSVLFGQKVKRLMEEDGTSKKELFEEAFDITFIAKAKEKAVIEHKALYFEIAGVSREIESLNSEIKTQLSLITNTQDSINSWQENLKTELKGYRATKRELKADIDEAEKELGKLELPKLTPEEKALVKDLDVNISKLSHKHSSLLEDKGRFISMVESAVKTLKDSTTKLDKAKASKKCPTCGQLFTPEGHKDHISDLGWAIAQAKNSKKEANLALYGVDKKIASAKLELDNLTKLRKKKDSLDSIKSTIESQVKSLDRLYKEMKSLKLKISDLSKGKPVMVENWENTLKEANLKLEELQKYHRSKKAVYDRLEIESKFYEWAIDTQLSNSGLKSFIFSIKLQALNDRLNYYSQYIGFRPRFEVNRESARKDIVTLITYRGKTVPYNDLSAGQQQLVNVATAFATHDVVVGDSKFNLLILDEIFENLSSRNIDIVSDLVMAKTAGKVVYMITHLSDFVPTGAKVLEFELKDNVTRPL